MPKNQQKKAVSSDRLAGAPYATRRTRGGGESGLLVEQDEEGKKQERRVTRSSQPNCSIYGLDRHLRYPGYQFCQNCTFYDNAVQANQVHHLSTKDSQIYRCRSKHTSWSFPTQKIVPHFSQRKMAQSNKARLQSNRNPSKKDSDDFSDDPSDSDSDSSQQQPHDEQSTIVIEETTLPISTATNEEDYLKEIQFLRLQLGAKDQKIISLEQRLKAAQRQCIRLENMGTLPQNNNLPAEGEEICLDVKGKERVLRRVLPALTHQKVHPRTNNRIIAKRIAGELFCAEYFGGHLKTEFMLAHE
jgi:hypothetical protein